MQGVAMTTRHRFGIVALGGAAGRVSVAGGRLGDGSERCHGAFHHPLDETSVLPAAGIDSTLLEVGFELGFELVDDSLVDDDEIELVVDTSGIVASPLHAFSDAGV